MPKEDYGVVDGVLDCNCVGLVFIFGSNKGLQEQLSEVT